LHAVTERVRYRASFSSNAFHTGGLLILKKTEAGILHLVLLNDAGFKLFDFAIREGRLQPVHVFEGLQKRGLRNGLLRLMEQVAGLEGAGRRAVRYDCRDGGFRIFAFCNGFAKTWIYAGPPLMRVAGCGHPEMNGEMLFQDYVNQVPGRIDYTSRNGRVRFSLVRLPDEVHESE
jgi:hypothetical protein